SVEVTTTVSRKAQRLSDTAAAVFVITAEDIHRSGVTSIAEALRMVPGIEVARLDANRYAITARGFNGNFANKLLVLMDGRTVYSPLYSGVFWDVQDTLLEDIARIEVIRGPGASLWGANAVNGVINIITKPAQETQGGLLTAGAGTEEKGFGGVRYGGTMGASAHYRAYAKYFSRDDAVDLAGNDNYDHLEVARGGGRMDWQLSDKDAVTLQGDYYDGQTAAQGSYAMYEPPYSAQFHDEIPVTGGNLLGRWQRTLSSRSDFIFQTYYDRTDRTMAVLSETRDTLDLDFQHRLGLGRRQEVLWGTGYRLTQANLDNGPTVTFRDENRVDQLFSFFVQDEIALWPEKLSLLVGSKFEENDYTGFEVQPNARLLWNAHRQHTFWGAVSRAVRTPSQAEHDLHLTQYVLPGPPETVVTFTGTEEFESEELTAYELGYRFVPEERLSLDLALFYNDYDKLRTGALATPYLDETTSRLIVPFYVANDMTGETYGAELAMELRPWRWWRLKGAYTCLKMRLHPSPTSADPSSEVAEGEVPRHQVSLLSYLDLPGNWGLDVWGRYVDDLPAQGISEYFTLDARLSWRPMNRLELALVGQNLLEKTHQEYAPDYVEFAPAEIEHSVYVKATWSF
ncbi:MAG: TonB-dependent receptor, partial [Desulfobacterales bacterium]|nr:TonB-dependent receptor [Desulfobacterales bacterium]